MLIGVLFGLSISGAMLTLLWLGVAGVLHPNATGTDWMLAFVCNAGWRLAQHNSGHDDYGIRHRYQLHSLHGNCIRSSATSKAASYVVGLDKASQRVKWGFFVNRAGATI